MPNGIGHQHDSTNDADCVRCGRFEPNAILRRLTLRVTRMNHQDHRAMTNSLPDNVIAFPGTHRIRSAEWAGDVRCAAPRPNIRAAAMTGAEFNARLLILLGICTASLLAVLSAIHVMHG